MHYSLIRFNPIAFTTVAAIVWAPCLSADTKTIDRRHSSDASQYYVVFASRPGTMSPPSPGHAWIVLGIEDATARLSMAESFGMYPKGKDKSGLGPVPAQFYEEARKADSDWHLLVIHVDKATYDAVSEIRKQKQQQAEKGEVKYSLYGENCVTFSLSVARQIGLNVPSVSGIATTPWRYAIELMKLND